MTLQPTAGHETAAERQSTRPSHGGILYFVLGLLPLSALIVYVVLQVMASNGAAATGGCGGG
jgi:hypothetical protein